MKHKYTLWENGQAVLSSSELSDVLNEIEATGNRYRDLFNPSDFFIRNNLTKSILAGDGKWYQLANKTTKK